MEQQRSPDKEAEMIEINLRQFMETARQHLLGLIPVQPPQLARIPVHKAPR